MFSAICNCFCKTLFAVLTASLPDGLKQNSVFVRHDVFNCKYHLFTVVRKRGGTQLFDQRHVCNRDQLVTLLRLKVSCQTKEENKEQIFFHA